jgi:hypothetical protein
MTNLAMKMALEFKRYMELENENGKAGNFENATYYMNKKWETSKAADAHGLSKEFETALKEIGVY